MMAKEYAREVREEWKGLWQNLSSLRDQKFQWMDRARKLKRIDGLKTNLRGLRDKLNVVQPRNTPSSSFCVKLLSYR